MPSARRKRLQVHFSRWMAILLLLLVSASVSARTAGCNQMVYSTGDAEQTLRFDPGNYVGPAALSWNMRVIEDQMMLTLGGHRHDTGCVRGTGSHDFQIGAGTGAIQVRVRPDCRDRKDSQWSLELQCPSDTAGALPPTAGDCDGDGSLTAADALCALQVSVGLLNVRRAVDLDQNGTVTSSDARLILQKVP